MSCSQRLRLGEVRRIHQLVGEITELGNDPDAWRTHALKGLRDLVHGQVALTTDLADVYPGRPLRAIQPIDLGWTSDAARRRFYLYLESGESAGDPAAQALIDLHQRARLVTFFRRQAVDDQTWYAAPSVAEGRRFAEIDDFVCSSFAIRPGLLHGFIVYRGIAQPRFDLHERRVMRMFHVQLLRRIIQTLSQPQLPNGSTPLSPRLHQTFDLLMLGDSVKEVAAAMSLSQHTVNDYMKELYRRFGVNSRAELMSKILADQQERQVRLPRELFEGWPTRA